MNLADIDRPLNSRGKRDAPFMSEKCKELGYVPEVLISSNANRAKSTADIFREKFGTDRSNYILEEKLYHAPEDTYIEVCFGLSDEVNSVMMFGHNPGITYLANSVSAAYIDNVPTCGVLVVDAKIKNWNQLDFLHCRLVDFMYPKKYR